MSNDKQRPEDGGEMAAMRRDLAEAKQIAAQQQALLDQQQKQIETMLAQRDFNGDREVKIIWPNVQREMQVKQDAAIASADAEFARADAALLDGTRRFRVCVIDRANRRELEQKRDQGQRMDEPWNWRISPFNPWRIVGGANEHEAKSKYERYFGITSVNTAEDCAWICYEVDAQGQPALEHVA